MTAETQWSTGRLGATTGSQRILFGHMHEDVEIEREAFRGRPRIFCIASAGCTAIRLSQDHEVVACDINPVQLAYAESRARGAPPVLGDAERFMTFARFFAPLVGWHRGTMRSFLALDDTQEQLRFWHARLETRRLRAGLDAMLSRSVLRMVYSPRLLSMLPARFGAVLRSRMERGFANHANASNPYARALLLGEEGDAPRCQISRILFVHDDAASYLESCAAGSFDGFTLSNILDGAEPSYRERVSLAVRHAAAGNAVVVSRSFAAPPREPTPNYAERDRSMLWGVVDVRSARSF